MTPKNDPRKDMIHRAMTGTTYWFEDDRWWAYYLMLNDPGPVSYHGVPYVLARGLLRTEPVAKVRDEEPDHEPVTQHEIDATRRELALYHRARKAEAKLAYGILGFGLLLAASLTLNIILIVGGL